MGGTKRLCGECLLFSLLKFPPMCYFFAVCFYPLGPPLCFLWRGGFSGALMFFWQPGGQDSCESSAPQSPREHSARPWPGLGTCSCWSLILSSPSPRASPLRLESPPGAGGVGGRGKGPGSGDVASTRSVECHTCAGHTCSLHGRQAFDRPSGRASRVGRESTCCG